MVLTTSQVGGCEFFQAVVWKLVPGDIDAEGGAEAAEHIVQMSLAVRIGGDLLLDPLGDVAADGVALRVVLGGFLQKLVECRAARIQ